MGKIRLSLGGNQPGRLEVQWTRGFGETSVRLNEMPLDRPIEGKQALREGRFVLLPDGTRLDIRLNRELKWLGLLSRWLRPLSLKRDGQPLKTLLWGRLAFAVFVVVGALVLAAAFLD